MSHQEVQPPINTNRLTDTFGDDLKFLTEMYELYVEDTRIRLQQLDAALSACDENVLQKVVHTLKGSSGNIGAERMCTLAEELERLDLDAARDLAPSVHKEFDAITQFVKAYTGTAT